MLIGNEVEITEANIAQLQKIYNKIIIRADEDMRAGNISVQELLCSVQSLPPNLKRELASFVKSIKADIEEAESIRYFLCIVGDYLNYSLLNYTIGVYGSSELKKEMAYYVQKMEAFRRETRLEVFSQVCDDKTDIDDGKFPIMVTKHKMDWATATLEDVEIFRKDICRELSLYDFSLKLVAVARGCVEITWQVPSSLVAYIQKSVKPSSPTMMKHHVTILTIDGFIAYDSTTGISLPQASLFHA